MSFIIMLRIKWWSWRIRSKTNTYHLLFTNYTSPVFFSGPSFRSWSNRLPPFLVLKKMVHFFQATQPGLHSWCKNSWPLPFLKTQRNGRGTLFVLGLRNRNNQRCHHGSPLSLEKDPFIGMKTLMLSDDPHRLSIFPTWRWSFNPSPGEGDHGETETYRCQMSRACKIYIQAHHSQGNNRKNLHIPVRWCPGW